MNERKYWILLARVFIGMFLTSLQLAVKVMAHVCCTQTEKPIDLLSIVMWLNVCFPALGSSCVNCFELWFSLICRDLAARKYFQYFWI